MTSSKEVRICVFCSGACSGDNDVTVSSRTISALQARALSTVLNFESEVSSDVESNYRSTVACQSCHNWVIEAELVVLDWEQILDRIRTVAKHLRIASHNGSNGIGVGDRGKRRRTEAAVPQLRELPRRHHETLVRHDTPDRGDDNEDDFTDYYLDPPSCVKVELAENPEAIDEPIPSTVPVKEVRVELVRCDHPDFESVAKPVVRTKSETLKRLKRKYRRQKDFKRKKYGNLKTKSKPKPKPKPKRATETGINYCSAPNCRFGTTDPDKLSGHFRRTHLNDTHPFKCQEPECAREFRDFRRFSIHRGTHRGQYPFVCEYCSKGFVRQNVLAEHINKNHTETPTRHTCHVCGRQCISKGSLNNHLRNYHSELRIRCTVAGCDHEAQSATMLRLHRARAHPDEFPDAAGKLQVCPHCGRTFRVRAKFDRHMLTHSDAPIEVTKPHACPYPNCEYRSRDKYSWRYHVTVVHETTEPTLSCTVAGCSAKFKRRQGLRVHLRTVHGPKSDVRYDCPYCEVKLKRKKGLELHIAVKHVADQNAFVCDRCQRGFAVKKYLDRHRLHNRDCRSVSGTGRAGKDELMSFEQRMRV